MSGAPVLFELGARGAIVLTGKDRASFLHGLVTNDIVKLAPGAGCAAAILTPKGKMLADCVVLCEDERLEIDCAPELSGKIEDLLRKYLVFNDVQIVNGAAEGAVFHLTAEVAGDAVEDLLRRAIGIGDGDPLPQSPHAHVAVAFPGAAAGGAIRIVRENRTGVPGFDARVPSSLSKEIFDALTNARARLEGASEMEHRRIAAGIPRWGFELTEAVLPDEAGLRERGFISENKGCYIGQETVARIKTYGHVNRRLVVLAVAGGVPKPGERIFFEGEECGAVTSATAGGAPGSGVALAFVKRERAVAGVPLTISSLAGILSANVAPVPLA